MESLEALEAHRRGVAHLIPILDAVRSIAELAWRHAERGFQPLERYAERLQTSFERVVSTLTREERMALAARDRLPVALLFVSSERGLCGPFNERVVEYGLAHARSWTEKGSSVRYLCFGNRSRRLLEAAGVTLLYTRALASLSVPAYVDIQEAALDLLELTGERAFGRLVVIHNAPARRFQYAPARRQLLPPVLPAISGSPERAAVIPTGDTPTLITHLMTEQLLVGLYRSVMESVISEQLARIYTMRLAADNTRRLVEDLSTQCNLARRNAITESLLEIVAGYDATVHGGRPGVSSAEKQE
ncbi:MAG TPA: FoF1 ATP synthase subunit gamma [Methylomirabilota bacterium]|jgi:F-type H+-transporting ATPase subunit gamma